MIYNDDSLECSASWNLLPSDHGAHYFPWESPITQRPIVPLSSYGSCLGTDHSVATFLNVAWMVVGRVGKAIWSLQLWYCRSHIGYQQFHWAPSRPKCPVSALRTTLKLLPLGRDLFGYVSGYSFIYYSYPICLKPFSKCL